MSSASKNKKIQPTDDFNRTIGCIEDIVISSEFQQLQTEFLGKYCMQFTNEEVNKIHYTDIFNEYTNLIEEFIMDNMRKARHNIDMNSFLEEVRSIGTTFDGEIFELLFSLSDYPTFKSLMLDYKEFKLNESSFSALNDCFTVTKLQ